jgi:hypothetical protein
MVIPGTALAQGDYNLTGTWYLHEIEMSNSFEDGSRDVGPQVPQEVRICHDTTDDAPPLNINIYFFNGQVWQLGLVGRTGSYFIGFALRASGRFEQDAWTGRVSGNANSIVGQFIYSQLTDDYDSAGTGQNHFSMTRDSDECPDSCPSCPN